MNRTTFPAIALLALALSACNDRAPAVDDAATPPPMDQAVDQPAVDQPAQDVPPATAPVDTAPPPAGSGLARYDGYGDMRFGMTVDEAKQAWGGELNGKPGEGETCYYLSPISNPNIAYFAFMIENGKFVRYDVSNDKEVAPGGGKRGMGADEIRKLYPGLTESNHKYVEGGKNLRVEDAAGSNGVLVFETGKDGKVSEWHAGMAPQVDYVEGCS
jgi:hypothetical protein